MVENFVAAESLVEDSAVCLKILNPKVQISISNKTPNPKPKNYDLIVYWDFIGNLGFVAAESLVEDSAVCFDIRSQKF